MSPLGWIGIGVLVYLALLARNAARQGELRKYLLSLAVVLGLLATLAGIAALYIWLVG